MAIPFSNAAAAYANAASRAVKPGGGSEAADGPSFGEMLRSATEQAVEVMHTGEQKSLEGAIGKADLTDVVNAVTNAETTMQAVVSVRDRVISAYQEILRMPM
ncbi:flagellar hook-basal body complex protein FliE [Indioceanicola profundi]|uniref:flagellar hook-basal body complex protein FliE n=1 Tax=Indioceanicola profundi TaxID=2220096 RepID=UPI000E6ABC0C|nr:flagellar hook-basal body complex protein FliE [Indioceanicola profundi]